MPDYTPAELAGWSGGDWTASPAQPITGVIHDTRVLQPGNLFVALRGRQADGHAFVQRAFERGAAGALVAADWTQPPGCSGALLRVPDPVAALRDMAVGYRQKLRVLRIGVTGSAGKTTVKDLVAGTLAARMPTARTRGNWNNDLGLPLSLLAMEAEHRAGVFELGVNHPREMEGLCSMLAPEWGVVTNVGPVHLGNFSSVAAIAEEKSVLLRGLPSHGVAFLNQDGEFFETLRARAACRVVSISLEGPADYQGTPDGGPGGACAVAEALSGERFDFRLPMPGRHNLANGLMAIAVARTAGVTWDEIDTALAHFVPPPMRWERREAGGVLLINDAYNANPMSMRAALDTFAALPLRGRKWVVVGAMLELGAAEAAEHRALGERMARAAWAGVLTVGPQGQQVAEGLRRAGAAACVVPCGDPQEAGRTVAARVATGDAVLFKASRGVRLEDAVRACATALEERTDAARGTDGDGRQGPGPD